MVKFLIIVRFPDSRHFSTVNLQVTVFYFTNSTAPAQVLSGGEVWV